MKKLLDLFALFFLVTPLCVAGNVVITGVIPPNICTPVGENTEFVCVINNQDSTSTVYSLEIIVNLGNQRSSFIVRGNIYLEAGINKVVMLWRTPKLGEFYYIVSLLGPEYEVINQFWPWSPFRIFGPKEAVDFIITHSSSKEEYDNHKKNMIKALLAVDSTFTYKIFDSSNMQTVIDYSLHIGCENIIKSEDTAISVQNFFRNYPGIQYFAAGPFNRNEYWVYNEPILDHVITTSACDQDGNRVYCYGEWLKFLSYSEPLAVSYSNCTTAGMTKEIGKKLKNIFNYDFSNEEVRLAARLSTGTNMARNDSAGYGQINTEFAFWESIPTPMISSSNTDTLLEGGVLGINYRQISFDLFDKQNIDRLELNGPAEMTVVMYGGPKGGHEFYLGTYKKKVNGLENFSLPKVQVEYFRLEIEAGMQVEIKEDLQFKLYIIPEEKLWSQVVDKVKPNTVNKFQLFQNYPNPFNSSTKVSFFLSQNNNIRLTVFNIVGEEVKKIEGKYFAGFNEIGLDFRDVSSGMYFYRLEANNFLETKNMLLIK